MKILGVDTLEFGIDVYNYLNDCKPLLSLFYRSKELAISKRKPICVSLNGLEMEIHPAGASFYTYRLTCKDFTVMFSDIVSATNSPIWARLNPGFLWGFGYRKAYMLFTKWLAELGVNIIGSRISRIDLSMDTDEAVFTREDEDGFVTRARNRGLFVADAHYKQGKVFSGYVFGKGQPLLCRMYNKTLEYKKSNKDWLLPIWKENGWQGKSEVWRVEFQLRRKFLKGRGLSSVENTFDMICSLWSYMTCEWISLRTHQEGVICSRWPVQEKWRLICVAGMVEEPCPLIRNTVKQAGAQRLMDQVNGLLKSIGAATNTLELPKCLQIVQEYCEGKAKKADTSFTEEVRKKQLQYL